jgi:histidinol-phosphate aminotransferase
VKTRKTLAHLEEYVPGTKKPGTVKLSSNENPFGPSPKALEAIRESAGGLNEYPDVLAGELKAALSEKLEVSAENLIVGNGSDEVFVLTAAAFLNPGERAIIPEHTFSQYEFATRLFDGEPVFSPMHEGRILLDEMLSLIDERTRLVFVCNPNNPTGTYVGSAELESFADRVPEDVLLVIDEAYSEFADADDFPNGIDIALERENVLVLRTFSKLYGLASLRVGYGIASPGVTGPMHKVKSPFNTGLLAQKAAAGALSDTDFVERTLANNREQRRRLASELSRLGMKQYPSQANFICTDCGRDSKEFVAGLAEHGVSVRPLTSFGMPTWLRISIGTPKQNKLLIDALSRTLSRDAATRT